MDVLKDVTEYFEEQLGESILTRSQALQTLKDLGPPDLCHLTKIHKQQEKASAAGGTQPGHTSAETGSYHHVSGVNASHSANLAVYINSLFGNLEQSAGWFGGKTQSPFRVKAGLYCCYNAFSRLDTRVEVRIPGGVDAYAVNIGGGRVDMNAQLWTETYVSAYLRALLDQNCYSFDAYATSLYTISGSILNPAQMMGGMFVRRIDPFKNSEEERLFLEACKETFFDAYLLGCASDIQTPSITQNHMITALIRYFRASARWQTWSTFLEEMYVHDPDVGGLLAEAYIAQDQEIKAVRVFYEALQKRPKSQILLRKQAAFLSRKTKVDTAVELGRLAVIHAPSEFQPWAILAELYIQAEDYHHALMNLNSSPMFAASERDSIRFPKPSRHHVALKEDVQWTPDMIAVLGAPNAPTSADMFLKAELERDLMSRAADPQLVKLHGMHLKGTFFKAYSILARMVGMIGWEELLRVRSQVFVMEEEYNQTREGSIDGRHSKPEQEGEEDPQDSTPLAPLPQPAEATPLSPNSVQTVAKAAVNDAVNGALSEGLAAAPKPAAPTVPSKDDAAEEERPKETEAAETNGDGTSAAKPTSPVEAAIPVTLPERGEAETLLHTKPSPKAPPKETMPGDEIQRGPGAPSEAASESPFKQKRLCERWLDSLFMTLFEDLRMFTLWQAEMSHYATNGMDYTRHATDWELLADLAFRLRRTEEARFAYQQSLDQTFSPRVWLKYLGICAARVHLSTDELDPLLLGVTRLVAYADRYHTMSVHPSPVEEYLLAAVRAHGFSKIKNSISIRINKSVEVWFKSFEKWVQDNQVEGYDQ